MELNLEIAEFTMKVARPLIWHDSLERWPKKLMGATCFILRFDAGLIGITATHVIEEFEMARKRTDGLVCNLRTAPLDLSAAIIERDPELDITTFSVTEDQLIESEAIPIDCRSEWLPLEPDKGDALSFAGFPEKLQNLSAQPNIEFRAFVNQCFVEDVTARDVIVTYEPERDLRVRAAPEFPGLGANLSGCSGGPVLMHVEHHGLHRWFPVGLIVAGAGDAPTGTMAEFDIIRIRRINAVLQDGTINRSAW
jgi:hypothetical protein